MECIQARVDSFRKTKRVKNPNKPNSSSNRKWPHPDTFLANPENLAEAGFYYDPSYDDPDNVICYYCHKELGGWEEEDNPFLIHWKKRGDVCCWAKVRCGLVVDLDRHGRFVSKEKTRNPSHVSMEEARLETFNIGKGWCHDKTKNSTLQSKMMARAGFVFTPQSSEDDLVTCLYCQTSLSGWEAGDDPMEEHRRRQDRSGVPCPFFSLSGDSTAEKQRTNATKASSKPPSRTASRSKHQDIVLPTKTEDGDGNDDSDVKAVKSGAKTPRKARSASGTRKSSAKTPRAKPRSTSQSSTKTAVNDEDADMEPEDVAAPPTVKSKKTRTRSKSVAKAIAPAEDSEDTGSEAARPSRSRTKRDKQADEAPPTKQSRSTSKSSLAIPEEKEGHSRKPSKSKAKPPPPAELEEPEAPITVKPKKTRTASRTKPKATTEVSDVESERPPSPRPPPSKHKGKTTARPPAPENLFDDDVVMEDPLPPPSSPPGEDPEPPKEISPLIIPKRKKTTKTPATDDETPRPQTEEPKPVRPRGRPKKVPPASSHTRIESEDVFESTENHIPEPAPIPTKAKPSSKVKSQSSKRRPTKEPTTEVDASTAEEEMSTDEREQRVVSQSLKANSPTELKSQSEILSVSKPPVERSRSVSRSVSNKRTTNPEVNMDVAVADPPNPNHPNPSTPARPHDVRPFQGDVRMEDVPTAEPKPVEPEVIPALSRLPFVPITTLSEAELDMTVEEWIRYQMEVEFDRFRRDGERELQQFRKRAEEVRQVIESL